MYLKRFAYFFGRRQKSETLILLTIKLGIQAHLHFIRKPQPREDFPHRTLCRVRSHGVQRHPDLR